MRKSCWALVLLISCGSDPTDNNGDGVADDIVVPNNVTVITPTRPLGFVAGEIWDAAAGTPLSDVTITLFGGGLTGEFVTDATGRFEIGPIAAGASFSLSIVRAGFVSATLANLTIDDMAGDFPTVNGALYVGPVGMLPSDGTFRVQVVSDLGVPVTGANVTIETAVRYLIGDAARGTAHAVGTTDADGQVLVEGLPNVRMLPPSFTNAAALTIEVAPVDLDGDGTADLSGATMNLTGAEVRSEAQPPIIVLQSAGAQGLWVVTSNVPGLAGAPATQPAILAGDENITVVFNKALERDGIVADLRTEDGDATFPVALVTSAFDNVLTIDPAEDLDPGLEYNLALRVRAQGGAGELLEVAAPFFTLDDPARNIAVTGTFVDRNGDGMWGTGNDTIELIVNTAVGRAGASPAFAIELLVALDLNGTATVGDAPGELPASGPQPAPIVLNAAEPAPGNGAGMSGFTTFVAPRTTTLLVPLTGAGTSVDMEVRFVPERNGGRFVTTPSGREAPNRFTGPLTLVN